MAITEVTLRFNCKKTGGANVFNSDIVGTAADKPTAEASIASQIQTQINGHQGDVDNKQAALDVFNAS